MNVISIDGVEYTKASIIAKQNKYTADYVGQLCRGRKVDAKLIGRTWYVNPLSLDSHKTTRYIKNSAAEKTINNKAETELSRLAVNPVPRKGTVSERHVAPVNFLKRVEWQPLKYEVDEYDLNPAMQSKSDPVRLNVNLVDARKVKITIDQKPIDLVAEELPQVSLSGKLRINSLDVDFDNNQENKASSDEVPVPFEVESALGVNETSLKKRKVVREISEKNATYPVEIKQTDNFSAVAFTPSRVVANKNPRAIPVAEQTAGNFVWPWYLMVFIFGALLAALMTLEIVLFAEGGELSWSINFSLSSGFKF